MPLEQDVDYVSDLVPTNPGAADPKSQGDDHIRNMKTAMLKTFAGFAGAVMVTGVDGGAADAYTLTPDTPLPSYEGRMFAVFVPVANNTGPSTLNISSLGAKPIVSVSGQPMVAGDLTAGRFYSCIYDGANFRLDSITQNYIDQLAISATLPGVNDPANAGKFLKAGGTWESIDLRGAPASSKPDSGTTAQVLNHADGEAQTIKATGAHNLSVAGLPVGRFAGILARLRNYGAFPFTTTGITWIKAGGGETAIFADAGIALPAAGDAHVLFFSYGDGVIYGKVGS